MRLLCYLLLLAIKFVNSNETCQGIAGFWRTPDNKIGLDVTEDETSISGFVLTSKETNSKHGFIGQIRRTGKSLTFQLGFIHNTSSETVSTVYTGQCFIENSKKVLRTTWLTKRANSCDNIEAGSSETIGAMLFEYVGRIAGLKYGHYSVLQPEDAAECLGLKQRTTFKILDKQMQIKNGLPLSNGQMMMSVKSKNLFVGFMNITEDVLAGFVGECQNCNASQVTLKFAFVVREAIEDEHEKWRSVHYFQETVTLNINITTTNSSQPLKNCSIPDIRYGNMRQISLTSFSVKCNIGYEIKGGSTILCLPNGTWNKPIPECQRDNSLSGCGGPRLLNNDSGTIMSHRTSRYQRYYKRNAKCEWLITVGERKVIQIRFIYFSLERKDPTTGNCNDVLKFYNGATDSSQSIGELCGYKSPYSNSRERIRSSGNKLLIRFTSNGSIQRSGFKLIYSSSRTIPPETTGKATPRPATMSQCGGPSLLSGPTGYITSKDFNPPAKYPSKLTCRWIINIPARRMIRFEFLHFDLEATRSCDYDFVAFYTGNAKGETIRPVKDRLCGTYNNQDALKRLGISVHGAPKVLIVFQTDANKEQTGFKIRYTTVAIIAPSTTTFKQSSTTEQTTKTIIASTTRKPTPAIRCGGLKKVYRRGYIQSPGYPNAYPANLTCTWILQASANRAVRLTFQALFLESHFSCEYDHVGIYQGNTTNVESLIKKYCIYSNYDNVVESLRSNITVRFVSDERRSGRGFRMRYEPIPQTHVPTVSCGGNISVTSRRKKYIQSPGYPNSYPPNSNCTWVLTARTGNVVKIAFTALNLENHYVCAYDHVGVYEGNTTKVNSLKRKFCVKGYNDQITSDGRTLTVRFVSDNKRSGSGFKLSYELATKRVASATCSETVELTNESAEIESPGFRNGRGRYPNQADCSWLIKAPEGKSIAITFLTFQLESTRSGKCLFDFLAIYKGNRSISANLIEKFCGRTLPKPIRSKTNRLLLNFQTDYTSQFKGFKLRYDWFTPCTAAQFTCDNGDCVAKSKRCDGRNDCSSGVDEAGCNFNKACGTPAVPPLEHENRIVGGMGALANSWPWMVQLLNRGQHMCGGTIIDNWFIMTAAHCFYGRDFVATDWKVYAGSHYKRRADAGQETRQVQKLLINKQYEQRRKEGDIALLMLTRPLVFNRNIINVCVPEVYNIRAGTPCIATGWGRTQNTGNHTILKQAVLPITEGKPCRQLRRSNTMICAGYASGGHDTCQGDSGGPLVCKETNNRWYQHGITSYGVGCARPRSPGVYTKVVSWYTWLKARLADVETIINE